MKIKNLLLISLAILQISFTQNKAMLSYFYTFKPQETQTQLNNGLYATAIKKINYYLYAQSYETNKNFAFEFLRTNANKGHIPFQYMLIKHHLKTIQSPNASNDYKKQITRRLLKLALVSLILTEIDIDILAPSKKKETLEMFLTDIELQTGYQNILNNLQNTKISRGDIIREAKKWIVVYLKRTNIPFISPNWLRLVTQTNNNKIWFEDSKKTITTENETTQSVIIEHRKLELTRIVTKPSKDKFWTTHYAMLFPDKMEIEQT